MLRVPSICLDLNMFLVLMCILDIMAFINAAQKVWCAVQIIKFHTPGILINLDMTLELQTQQTGLTGWVPAAADTCCCWIPKTVSRAGDGSVCKWEKKECVRWRKKRLRRHARECVSCVCLCVQFKKKKKVPPDLDLQVSWGLFWKKTSRWQRSKSVWLNEKWKCL